MKLTIVVAVAQNDVIGVAGDLPWRISDDLKWFKEKTLGKPIIMGRKTFASIGKALPGRDNIVVTRSPAFSAPGVFVARRIDEAIKLAKACAKARGVDEVCIIGGGEIYAQTIDLVDRVYLTRVDADVKGDAFFTPMDALDWREIKVGEAHKGARNSHDCTFFVLDRRREE
ncbi:MAG: dihydrofolate reductase [Pseudomonadota bacterium]